MVNSESDLSKQLAINARIWTVGSPAALYINSGLQPKSASKSGCLERPTETNYSILSRGPEYYCRASTFEQYLVSNASTAT
jgi:hypothetical protein